MIVNFMSRGAIHILFLNPFNNVPGFTSPANVNVPENSTLVMTVTASDADQPPQTVNFSIVGGADQDKFAITAGGSLTFYPPPNFEAPVDDDGDNVYIVAVQVNDGNGGIATQTIAVTVTPINDNTPVFSSADLVDVPENTTNVLTVTATDADLPPQTVTYSLVGGSDQSRFNITSGGVLSFKSPPDFEAPADLNGDNVYIVIVQASDGSLTNLQAILVTVTDTSEAPLAGDYNNSGTVDLADYVVWRNALNQAVTLPNDSTPGMVTQADHDVWRANFGRTAPSSASTSASAAALLELMSERPIAEKSSEALRHQSVQVVESTLSVLGPPIHDRAPSTVRTCPNGRDAFSPFPSHDDALVAWLASRNTRLHRESTAAGGFNSLETPTDRLPPAALPIDTLDVAFATLGVTLE